MKLAILICGEFRCVDLVMANLRSLYHDCELSFTLSLCRTDTINLPIEANTVIFTKDLPDGDRYKNCLNYIHRLSIGIPMLPPDSDMYMIIRSDTVLQKRIDLEEIRTGVLSFADSDLNPFNDMESKVCEAVILSRDWRSLWTLRRLDEFCRNHPGYLDSCLYAFLKEDESEYDTIQIDFRSMITRCSVIGITGDSGSGKTTLMRCLSLLFDNQVCLETDRYHKWERGDKNYDNYTHLHPYANHLETMRKDVFQLKIGNDIHQVDYDHETGRFTQKEKIGSADNLIVCGLHTFYEAQLKELIDLKVFMDTEPSLQREWKMRRDTRERGHDTSRVEREILRRKEDREKFVESQKKDADLLIRFFRGDDDATRCQISVCHARIMSRLLPPLIEYGFLYNWDGASLVIDVSGETIKTYPIEANKIITAHADLFISPHYREILIIFMFLLS